MSETSVQDELQALREHVRALSISVQFNDSEPFEAFHAKYAITGSHRTALKIALSAVLERAQGKSPSLPHDDGLLQQYPSLGDVCRPGPIDVAEAVRQIGHLLYGNQARALEYIQAHAGRGLGAEGHAALGI